MNRERSIEYFVFSCSTENIRQIFILDTVLDILDKIALDIKNKILRCLSVDFHLVFQKSITIVDKTTSVSFQI